MGLFTTGEVACDIRARVEQVASLATTVCHAFSSELGVPEAMRKLQCSEDAGVSRERMF